MPFVAELSTKRQDAQPVEKRHGVSPTGPTENSGLTAAAAEVSPAILKMRHRTRERLIGPVAAIAASDI